MSGGCWEGPAREHLRPPTPSGMDARISQVIHEGCMVRIPVRGQLVEGKVIKITGLRCRVQHSTGANWIEFRDVQLAAGAPGPSAPAPASDSQSLPPATSARASAVPPPRNGMVRRRSSATAPSSRIEPPPVAASPIPPPIPKAASSSDEATTSSAPARRDSLIRRKSSATAPAVMGWEPPPLAASPRPPPGPPVSLAPSSGVDGGAAKAAMDEHASSNGGLGPRQRTAEPLPSTSAGESNGLQAARHAREVDDNLDSCRSIDAESSSEDEVHAEEDTVPEELVNELSGTAGRPNASMHRASESSRASTRAARNSYAEDDDEPDPAILLWAAEQQAKREAASLLAPKRSQERFKLHRQMSQNI